MQMVLPKCETALKIYDTASPPFRDPSYRQIHGCFDCGNPHCAVSQGPCPFAVVPDEMLIADANQLVILSGCGEFSTKTILNYKEQLTGVALLLDGEFTARGGTGAYFPIADQHEFIQEIERCFFCLKGGGVCHC